MIYYAAYDRHFGGYSVFRDEEAAQKEAFERNVHDILPTRGWAGLILCNEGVRRMIEECSGEEARAKVAAAQRSRTEHYLTLRVSACDLYTEGD